MYIKLQISVFYAVII